MVASCCVPVDFWRDNVVSNFGKLLWSTCHECTNGFHRTGMIVLQKFKKDKQKVHISKQRLVLSLFVSLVTGTNAKAVCIILNLHLFIAVHNLFSKRFAPINKNPIHLWKLTWKLKITPLKGKLIFQTFIFRFHLSFRGGGVPTPKATVPTPNK